MGAKRAAPGALALVLDVDGLLRGRFALGTPLAAPEFVEEGASSASMVSPRPAASGRRLEVWSRLLEASPCALAAPERGGREGSRRQASKGG